MADRAEDSWSLNAVRADETVSAIVCMRIIKKMYKAKDAIHAQAALHRDLIRLEWQEEKRRWLKILALGALSVIFLFCSFAFIGVLVILLSWDTQYRLHSVVGLVITFALAVVVTWWRLLALVALGRNAFIASREELAADIAMFKNSL